MDYYQLPELKKRKELFHAFSTKEAGDFGAGSKVDDEIIKKRINWLKKFNIDSTNVITLPLAGGTDVFVLKSIDQKFPDQFDSAITNLKNLYFVLIVADCLPVIIYDSKKEVLGLVHAGWRGLDGGIIGKTIDEMVKVYEISPQDLVVGIGPSIHKNSYIKDSLFKEKVSAKLNKYIFQVAENKFQIDLIFAAVDEMASCGVEKSNIEVSNQDTFSNNYFSHHRAKTKKEPEDRNLAVVGLL